MWTRKEQRQQTPGLRLDTLFSYRNYASQVGIVTGQISEDSHHEINKLDVVDHLVEYVCEACQRVGLSFETYRSRRQRGDRDHIACYRVGGHVHGCPLGARGRNECSCQGNIGLEL